MNDAGSNGPILGASESGEFNAQPMPAPGARLAAYREERGWSIEQVASQLNLAPRQIQAIENDDYPALPPVAVLRGFVRAYAKLLKVDPIPLLAKIGGPTMVVNELPAPRRSATRFSEPRFPSITDRRRPSGKHFALLILIAVGLGVAWMAWPPGDSSSTLASLFGRIEAIWASASGSEEAAPDATTVSESPVAIGSAAPAPASDAEVQAPSSKNAEPVVPLPAVPQVNVPPVAAPEASTALKSPASSSAETLVLKMREDSWLQVKRVGGDGSIISRVVKAGETETVELKEPVSVVIGNVSGVDATLRGKPLELKAKASNNVARLSLK